MANLNFKAYRDLPSINFDADTGILSITGHSIFGSDPEFVDFFEKIDNWIENYVKSPAEKTEINIQLDYFCTTTSKRLLNFFQRLEKIRQSGKQIIINWFFPDDDPDMETSGQEYSDIIEIPFNFIKYKPE